MQGWEAMKLAVRCARDSVPPLRLAILIDVLVHPSTEMAAVRKRVGKPWHTVKRELEALTMLGLLRCDEENGRVYGLADDFDKTTLRVMAGMPPVQYSQRGKVFYISGLEWVDSYPHEPRRKS
jgi:hypothetical protein